MIQELFGTSYAGLVTGEKKLFSAPSVTPPPLSSAPVSTAASPPAPENQNLRCPRCDSSNTKFCYYNNYNLTQPRHFCKTCRRYWTKGGALRNVPIGGGCRKNRSTSVSASFGKQISAGKLLRSAAEIGNGGFEPEVAANHLLFGAPLQTSELFGLLRGNRDPNPKPNFPSTLKSEGLFGGSLVSISHGFDPVGQVAPGGLCNTFWGNRIQQSQQQEQERTGGAFEDVQSAGILPSQLRQRLRQSPAIQTHPDHTSAIFNNVASSTSSTVLKSTPVPDGESGLWSPTQSWHNVPATTSALP